MSDQNTTPETTVDTPVVEGTEGIETTPETPTTPEVSVEETTEEAA
ncbi:MAG: hypothetical protein ACK42D_00490 [Candidatus Paceibacteria bacterium]